MDERFAGKVRIDPITGCHIWTGARGGPNAPYGRIRIDRKLKRAHRVAYELAYGPIPQGQLVRHMCHTTLCVNYKHLRSGSSRDNSEDMMEAGRSRFTGPRLTDREAATMIGMQFGRATYQEIADEFEVSYGTVSSILHQRARPDAIDNELDKETTQSEAPMSKAA